MGRRVRTGWAGVGGVRRHSLRVAGVERAYWLAPGPPEPSPLVIMLHGSGTTGRDMARFTGLADRGPAGGIAVAFPDGWRKVWDDGRLLRRPAGIDDPGFIAALVEELVRQGVATNRPPTLVGLSNGASFAERIARRGLVPRSGLVLAAGTTLESSRQQWPVPAAPAWVLIFMGTADPLVPYAGGPSRMRGPIAWISRRRGRRGPSAGAEPVARDWATANGLPPDPVVHELPTADGDLAVTELTWAAAGRPSVRLLRIEGSGHTWPGGPQYLPARIIGPGARGLDATGMLLEAVRQQADITRT